VTSNHAPAAKPARLKIVRIIGESLEESAHLRPAPCSLVVELALGIGRLMGLRDKGLERLQTAVRLRDIGKLGIPDKVLHKTTPLTDEEWVAICTHPSLGRQLVREIGFLRPVANIIDAHHERFDGKGYPKGRRGESIPLEARICSVADAYHSMVTDRPYRKALPTPHAHQEIIRNSGTQFDPSVVNAFAEAERALAAGLCAAATSSEEPATHTDLLPQPSRSSLRLASFRLVR
jgi:HD-GYP domain-containing protein (c-di-GMP phosphodiesterase class II)